MTQEVAYRKSIRVARRDDMPSVLRDVTATFRRVHYNASPGTLLDDFPEPYEILAIQDTSPRDGHVRIGLQAQGSDLQEITVEAVKRPVLGRSASAPEVVAYAKELATLYGERFGGSPLRGRKVGTEERVREMHRLLKEGKSRRQAKGMAHCDPTTYERYCKEVTGEDPIPTYR